MALGIEREEHIHRCMWENVEPVPEVPFIQYVMDKMMDAGEKAALVSSV